MTDDATPTTQWPGSDEEWRALLQSHGWDSWTAAVSWAGDRGAGWKGLAQRLGIDWQVAQIAAAVEGCGEALDTQWERKGRLLWAHRLADRGWRDWGDALTWAASEHEGYEGVATELGISAMQSGRQIRHWCRAIPTWPDRVAAQRISAPGHLETDASGMHQCHVCALWFVSLVKHVGVHGLDSVGYRAEFDLGENLSLGPVHGRHAPRHEPDYWDVVLERAGFVSLAAAARWAQDEGLSSRDLAVRLDVPYHYLLPELRRTKTTLTRKRDRMLVAARREVEAGGDLSNPSDTELRRWMISQRTTHAAGKTILFEDELDALDPLWRVPGRDRGPVTEP